MLTKKPHINFNTGSWCHPQDMVQLFYIISTTHLLYCVNVMLLRRNCYSRKTFNHKTNATFVFVFSTTGTN